MQKTIDNLINIFETLIAFLVSPKMITWYWHTANSFALLVTSFLMTIKIENDFVSMGIVAGLIAGLNRLTKYLNKKK